MLHLHHYEERNTGLQDTAAAQSLRADQAETARAAKGISFAE